ncbi:PAS domain S-box protein [Candidatus Daviesbacteria bacterium]|nr:PAS domain S-box protein [Candidatus Daviesbacteria bacterium]
MLEKSIIDEPINGDNLYRSIFENAIEGIYQSTPEGKILTANPALAKILGYESVEDMTSNLVNIKTQFYVNSSTRDKFIRLIRSKGLITDFESQVRKKDGDIIWISENARAVKNKNGEIIYFEGLVQDITDRKLAEEEKAQLIIEQSARAEAENANLKLSFLVEASKILSQSLDYRTSLKNLARLIVPIIADWCIIDLVEESNNTSRVEVVHIDSKKNRLANILKNNYPLSLDSSQPAALSLKLNKPLLVSRVDTKWLSSISLNTKHLKLLKALGVCSYMAIPIISRGHMLGIVTFSMGDSGRHYQQADLILANDLAGRVAISIENSLLFQGAKQEIGERKKAEDKLRIREKEYKKQKNQLEVILQNVSDGIAVQGKEGKLMFVNSAAARTIGYDHPKNMLKESNNNILDLFELKEENGNPFPLDKLPSRLAVLGKNTPETIIRFRKKDTNHERWSLVKATPVFDDKGEVQFVVNVFHDVTELKLVEKHKDEFLAIASHELKTPITTIKAFTQLIQARLIKTEDGIVKAYLEKVNLQLDKLTRLVNELLDLSKMEKGSLPFYRTRFDFNKFIKDIVGSLQPAFKTHKLILKGYVSKRVYWDKDRVSEVMVNLITNAVKYSPGALKVLIKTKEISNHMQIEVQDFGIGIPKEFQKRVFDRFFQVVKHKGETYAGLGLGLYISSQIIRQHRGKISVRSNIGKGSSFIIRIPIEGRVLN